MGKSKNNKGKGRSSRGKQNGNRGQASDSIVHYRGPVVPRGTANADHIEVVRLVFLSAGTSNAGGVMALQLTNNPASTSDWVAFASVYTKYRVLAQRFKWVPNSMGFLSGSAALQAPAVIFTVRSNTAYTLPTSYTAAYDNDGARVQNLGRTFSSTVRMDGDPDAIWQDTQSPISTWTIALFSSGLTPSATYGQVFSDYLVQFRGRV